MWGRVCQQGAGKLSESAEGVKVLNFARSAGGVIIPHAALALAILSILRRVRAALDLMHMPIITRPATKIVRVRWDGMTASARTLHLVPHKTHAPA